MRLPAILMGLGLLLPVASFPFLSYAVPDRALVIFQYDPGLSVLITLALRYGVLETGGPLAVSVPFLWIILAGVVLIGAGGVTLLFQRR